MKTTSTRIWKKQPAVWLGLPVLLLGLWAPVPARSAPLPAGARLVAGIDINLVLEAPPPPRHEVIVERDRPSRDHVWVAGYWAYHHGRHDWVAGHWERPPHGRTVWNEPRWERRDRGYVFVEGFWSDGRRDHDDHHDRH